MRSYPPRGEDARGGGSTFADALADHPKASTSSTRSWWPRASLGGILEPSSTAGGYIEKNQNSSARWKGAMTYPAIVIVAGIWVVAPCCC
jgi:type II secretory pathway component PulF